jgi:lipoprotein signal peptidase
VLGEWVRLTLAFNPGGALGLWLGPATPAVLALGAAAALAALWRRASGSAALGRLEACAFGLLAGGAAANAAGRLLPGVDGRGVVDFLDLGAGTARVVTCNLADLALAAGALALLAGSRALGLRQAPTALPSAPAPDA